MSRTFLVAVLFLSALAAEADMLPQPESTPSAPAAENRAVRVTLRGGIVGFDDNSYRLFRGVVAGLVFDGVVGKFITESYDLEGGGVFCIELGINPKDSLTKVTEPLKYIQTDPRQTEFTTEPLLKCL